LVRFGATRFRADRPVSDARFSADGKRVVGCVGGTLYVWDARDGSLLRTIDTKLEELDDPTKHGEKWLAFAVHPKEDRVACGGIRGGKTVLQVWDFGPGKLVAEKASPCDAMKALAWTPDGRRLLERANVGWLQATGWKLIVRDGTLAEVRSHDLPTGFGKWSTVMLPLPGSEQVILWQSGREPAVIDLDSGTAVRTLPHKVSIASDLGVSPDGKTLAATDTKGICLLDLPGGEVRHRLPVLRDGWWKPRPLFSPDGGTVYVWDHRPIAYDVATGKEKWRAAFRTLHTVRVQVCDVSPDGATLLARHGQALSLLDAATGAERDPAPAPSAPADLVWSPDGKTLFTRKERHDRTWTAWDAATGKRLYDLQPTGQVKGEDWKMVPDLFFIAGGKEIAACVERAESPERAGPKEFLVFDAATGRYLRRLGEPLPDKLFLWTHPISVDPAGKTVLMQAFVVSAPEAEERYATIRWDPVKQAKLREWTVEGSRTESPRHFAPYDVKVAMTLPDLAPDGGKGEPGRIRCYSTADGRPARELRGGFIFLEPDRVEGNFLLASGHDGAWVRRWNITRITPHPPFAYDLWELPSRDKIRVLELGKQDTVVLGPGARYVLHATGGNAFEVHEPFVLRKAVAAVATPSRPERFEFSPAGGRLAASLADTTVAVWDAGAWRAAVDRAVARDVPADLTPLWEDLARDAVTGLRAARQLSVAGDRAVALLREKVAPRRAPDEARVRQWIADLDASGFAAREKAEKALRDLGGPAEPYLRKAMAAEPSPEAKQRIGKLLREIEARRLTPAEVREVRAVQALAWMDSAASRALLAEWAKGDPAATLTGATREVSDR
jgi:WD40 repeat protein